MGAYFPTVEALVAAAQTTVVRPVDAGLRSAVRLALLFSLLKLLLQVAGNVWQAHLGWGYFRDEFYYVACGRRLAWGYVDHGPVVAVQARLAEAVFGRSLAGLRMFAALAGATRVFLTGVLAWAMGGRRAAQGLAMIGVLVVPNYLAIDGFLSMNSFESIFWMGCLLCLIGMERRLERGEPERQAMAGLWVLFGVLAGVGLLNKPSMTFFLVALLLGLLMTPARRLLGSRWALVGVGLMVLIALPNLLWQVSNHWPTLEFLENGRRKGKNVELGPLAFWAAQVREMHPLDVLVWCAGLWSLLFGSQARRWRWVGLTFVVFMVGMMGLHAKDYYCTPVYPVLFAAGGIAWERRFRRRRDPDRVFAFPVLEGALVVSGLLILPMAIPVLRPDAWLRYTEAMHLRGTSSHNERAATSGLPQFYADRFGWDEYLGLVERAYASLSPEERGRVTFYADNYGEAGAIEFFARQKGLRFAPVISGHNAYWMWGTHGKPMDPVIAISGGTPEELAEEYASVTVVGRMDHPLAMPHEHKYVYLLRGRKVPFVWREKKDLI